MDEYIIVFGRSELDLKSKVNKRMKEGYIPIGGVAIIVRDSVFCQGQVAQPIVGTIGFYQSMMINDCQ